ncbi:YraN family protein [Gilvimarinus chinensis]|uniref:YraN family protein n=1 Tax=Gilvimarinus chinensis TaxID=396005 RepID=UPI00035F1332|nr:YraN family protein [Gilvimarinus chinensis]
MAFFRKQKNKATRGELAEQQARTFLQQQGLHYVAANIKGPGGEIDLIMREQQTLIFVEVRLRSNVNYSSAAESVNASKQHKLIKTAAWYLQQQKLTDEIPCRFDVVALSTLDGSQPPLWIVDAFGTA